MPLWGKYPLMLALFVIMLMQVTVSAQVQLPAIPSNTQMSNNFEYNSEYVYRVSLDGTYLEDGAIIAYVDGKIRGAQTASVLFTPTNTMVYKIRLFSNSASGEVITFKYFDVNRNKVYDITETQTFQADNVPDYNNPQTLSAYCGVVGKAGTLVPENGAGGLDNSFNVYWEPAGNATHYSIYLWKDGDSQPAAAYRSDIYGTSGYVSGLEYGATYNWYVQSFNQCGDEVSDTQSFTVRDLPDLVVTSLSAPDTVMSSDPFDVELTVKNIGEGNTRTGHSWYNAVYVSSDDQFSADDKLIGKVACNRVLMKDSSYTQTVSIAVPADYAGSYHIFVKADVYSSIPEADNDNNLNQQLLPLWVKAKPLPDILVENISSGKTSYNPGDTITVTWDVKNIGVADAEGGWTERVSLLSLSGIRVNLTGTPVFSGTLSTNATQARSFDFVIPEILNFSGEAKIEVQLNPSAELIELPGNDVNNASSSNEHIYLSEKLYLTIPSTQIREDYPGTVRCYVARSGSTTDDLTVNLSASVQDVINIPSSVTIPVRNSSGIFDITPVDNSLLDGTRTVTVTAEATGLDSRTKELSILDDEIPSLSITLNADTLREGDTVNVTISRDLAISDSTVVYLAADRNEQLTLPEYVVIPGGQNSVQMSLVVVQDNMPELDNVTKFMVSSAGLVPAEKSFVVMDDDIPVIDMELESDTVAEGDGAYATTAVIKRTEPGTCDITINITANISNAVYFPTAITLRKDEMSKKINIGVIDNTLVDGFRDVEIKGEVYVASCSCGAPAASGGVVSRTLTIIDNDGPSLTLTIDPASLKEGLDNAGTLTVFRNTSTTTDLTVSLSTNDTSEIELPATVVIPAGEQTVNVALKTKDDNVDDGTQMVSIKAGASGFNPGMIMVYVTDINKPDLEMTDIELGRDTVLAGDFVRVESQILNNGYGTASTGVVVNFYLSTDELLSSDDTLFYSIKTKEPVLTGSSISMVEAIPVPAITGSYHLITKINPEAAISELVYKNNDAASDLMTINPSYTATAQTETEELAHAAPVIITGTATTPSGENAVNVDLDVYVICDGSRRVIKTTTDANGDYVAEFKPLSYETGHFSIGACYPGQDMDTEMDAFDIMGMERVSNDYFVLNIKKDVPESGTIEIKNRSNIPLHNVSISAAFPDSCIFTADTIAQLDGGAVAAINYTIEGKTVTPGINYMRYPVIVHSEEGADFKFTAYYYCQALASHLEADPVSINTSFTKGKVRYYEVLVRNIGAGETGEVNIELPDVSYMSLVSPQHIDNISSGDTVVITLAFSADDDIPLNVPLSGNFVAHVTNGDDLSVPYQLQAVSEDKGNLIIDVVDEYTYFTDDAPHVEDAHVELRHPYTGEIIGEGFTDSTGVFRIDSIPEGEYTLKVEKDKHDGYQKNITVDPGIDTRKTVFLDFQAITYSWDVVPVDLEDHYQVDLIMEYETNVPVPVVVMEMPKEMPELTGDETYTFMVTITNKGLLTAQHVELQFPEDDPEYEWIFSFPQSTLVAQQAIQVPVTMRRRTSAPSGTKAPDVAFNNSGSPLKGVKSITTTSSCTDYSLTLYDYKCGSDWKLHKAGALFTFSGRACDGYGTVSGGITGGSMGPGHGDGGKSGSGHSTYTGDSGVSCNPCFNSIAGAALGCLGASDFAGCLWGFTDGVDLDDWKGCVPTGPAGCPLGILDALSCIYLKGGGPPGGPSASEAAKATVPDPSNLKGGSILYGVSPGPVMGTNDYLLFIWHLIQEEQAVINFFDTREKYATEINGTINWQDKEGFGDFMLNTKQEVVNEENFIANDIVALKTSMSGSDFTDDEIDYFTDRWNRSVDAWNQGIPEPDSQHPDIINKNKIDSLMSVRDTLLSFAYSNGFNSISEMHQHVLSYFMEIKDQHSTSVCASVTIKLSQELVMTREAFEGTLTIENGNATNPMEDIELNIEIKNSEGIVCNDLFHIETKALDVLTGIDGTGVLGSKQKGSATMLFIPEKGAAPEVPVSYSFGGTFSYKDPYTGLKVTKPLNPVTLQVNPSPDLYLHYFMQRNILGDDALTKDIIEPVVPAELGLMIVNNGYGVAKNVRVESAQPEIIDNEKGLAIHFALIGSNLNGQERQLGLTNINFGNIDAHKAAIGQWWFTSDLLGHFIRYSTNVTHLDSRGDPDLSLISGAALHELIKSVKVYGAGEDGINDFLVNDVPDSRDIPDAVYMSQGDVVLDVYEADAASFEGSLSQSTLKIVNSKVGWNYISIDDPGNGAYEIVSITRNWDGVEIPPDNAWLTFVTLPDGQEPVYENKFHIVDNLETSGLHEYTVVWKYMNKHPLQIDSIYTVPDAVTSQQVTSLNVKFSKPIDESTFDYEDLTLRFQGGDNIINSSAVITKIDSVNYNIDLSSLTTGNGFYALTVQAAGITAADGNAGQVGKQAMWTQFLTVPAVEEFIGIPDTTVTSSFDYCMVKFNMPVDENTVLPDRFTVKRNGVVIAASLTVTKMDVESQLYKVSGLTGAMSADGEFILSVDLTNIANLDGEKGLAEQTASWTLDTTPPVVSGFTPDSKSGFDRHHYTGIEIEFDEPVYGIDVNSVELWKDGVRQPLSQVHFDYVGDNTWYLTQFRLLTYYEGDYKLKIKMENVYDNAGLYGSGFSEFNWTVDRSAPLPVQDLSITPDLGYSDSDNITSVDSFNVNMTVMSNDVDVEVYRDDFGELTLLADTSGVSSGALALPVGISSPGNIVLDVHTVNSNGNYSSSQLEMTVDRTALNAELKVENVTFLREHPDTIQLIVSDKLLEDNIDVNLLSLEFEDEEQAISGVTIEQQNDTLYYIRGLRNLEAKYGNYTLSIDLAGLHKYRSGLGGNSTASVTWFIEKQNHAPVANAGDNFYITAGSSYSLDASGSFDPDNDALMFRWYPPEGFELDDSTSVTPSFVAPANIADTVYTFALVVSDGEKSSTSKVNVFYSTATNEEMEISIDNIILYPNPCTTQFTVYTGKKMIETVKLIDMSGAVLLVEKWNGDREQTIRIGALPKGVYIVQIKTDEKTINRKLLVK